MCYNIHYIRYYILLNNKKNYAGKLKKGPQGIHLTDFNLSGDCFGTDIIQNCTKWSNMEVHGRSFGPIFAKFHCASFLFQKVGKDDKMVQKNTNMPFFVKQIFEKLHASSQSWKKQTFRYNLLKFNESNYL